MKIAYSTNAYTRTTLAEAVDSIGRLGFDGIEILCDAPHWSPGNVEPADIDRIAEALAVHGLGVSNLNANTANLFFDPLPAENTFEPSLSSSRDEYRRWRVKYSIDTLHLAKAVGATCISVTSGQPGSGGRPGNGMALMTESLKAICDEAEKIGINVGIEYEPGLLVERASEVMELVDRVGSDRLGVNLDIGHSYLSRESPAQTIKALSGRIWNVHIEDIVDMKHYHLVPGTGEMPLREYIDAFDAIGYDNYLTVELYTFYDQPEAAGAQSLQHLRQLTQA